MTYDQCRELAARALRLAGTPLDEATESDKHAFSQAMMTLAGTLAPYGSWDSWDKADDAERDRVAWQLAASSLAFKQHTTAAAAELDRIRDKRWRELARQRLVQVISEE